MNIDIIMVDLIGGSYTFYLVTEEFFNKFEPIKGETALRLSDRENL